MENSDYNIYYNKYYDKNVKLQGFKSFLNSKKPESVSGWLNISLITFMGIVTASTPIL